MASGTVAGGDMRQQRRSSGQQTAEPDLLPGPMDAERSSAGSVPITNVGKLRGEDYLFEFAGKVWMGVRGAPGRGGVESRATCFSLPAAG